VDFTEKSRHRDVKRRAPHLVAATASELSLISLQRECFRSKKSIWRKKW